jgi:hypothetical protein
LDDGWSGGGIMSETKTIGVAVDNYKVKKFKEALAELGYPNVKVTPMDSIGAKDTSLISVENVPADHDSVHAIHRLCMKLQTDFTRSN